MRNPALRADRRDGVLLAHGGGNGRDRAAQDPCEDWSGPVRAGLHTTWVDEMRPQISQETSGNHETKIVIHKKKRARTCQVHVFKSPTGTGSSQMRPCTKGLLAPRAQVRALHHGRRPDGRSHLRVLRVAEPPHPGGLRHVASGELSLMQFMFMQWFCTPRS